MLNTLPGIDRIIELEEIRELLGEYSHEVVVGWVRDAVEDLRSGLLGGREYPLGEDGKIARETVAAMVQARRASLTSPSLRKCVNATGVVVHTNMGRSPLSPYLMEAMKGVLGTYSNLEYDLEKGKRGSRHSHLERLIRRVTGAEAGFAVNNNAASVLVSLNTLARGGEVIVSRGELIEIGGSFRIPEIIESGGARLREVGTTNKTRVSDYERAIGPETSLILKAHTSNYRIQGFTEEVSLQDLVRLGQERGVPVMMDLGSGLLIDLEPYGIFGEDPVQKYVAMGPDVITFSGDKLLGGPQAGFIVGRAELVSRIQKNPMVRALRVGKITIAALEAMLTAYLSPAAITEKIPTLRLLTRPAPRIRSQAARAAAMIRERWPEAKARVLRDEAFAGGGSLPAVPLPTYVVEIEADMDADGLHCLFRSAPVPVVGRVRKGAFCLDMRTILPGDLAHVLAAVDIIRESGK